MQYGLRFNGFHFNKAAEGKDYDHIPYFEYSELQVDFKFKSYTTPAAKLSK